MESWSIGVLGKQDPIRKRVMSCPIFHFSIIPIFPLVYSPVPASFRERVFLFLNIKQGKEEGQMTERENDRGHFLLGVLIGGVLGGLAALLYAPKTGKELRAEIREKGLEAFEEAKHAYSDVKSKAKAILEDAQRRAEELKREADRQLAEARLKAKDILKGVEEKAADVSQRTKDLMEGTRTEVKKVKGAVEAGVEAAKQEYVKEKEKKA
jgi:gas vesicle protein